MIPVLHSPRLVMGPPDMGHLAAFTQFCLSDHARFMGGPGDADDAWESVCLHAGQWALRGYGTFWLALDGQPVGRVGIWHPAWLPEPELSWVIYQDHTRQGLAVEAAERVLVWWRDMGKAPPVSLIDPANDASQAVARRLGAQPDGEHAYASGKLAQRWRHRGAA